MEWHIWDFPDNIRVYLTNEFRLKLYDKLKEICGSQTQIAKKLGVSRGTIIHSLIKGQEKQYKRYVSVKTIKKIVKIFGSQLGDEFLNAMEKNIIAYISRSRQNVENPRLPIKECPELYSIVFHLIGDGNASKRHSPYYSSKDKELIEEFERYLQIFGDIKCWRKIIEHKGVIISYFPKAIADILSHIMGDIKFTYPDALPQRIFEAPFECKIAAVRAFFDDEGCVTKNIRVFQKSKNILLQLKQLMNSVGIESGKICTTYNKYHTLYVLSTSYENFQKFVGFTCIRKREKLKKLIKTRQIRVSELIEKNQTQYRILKLLMKKTINKT